MSVSDITLGSISRLLCCWCYFLLFCATQQLFQNNCLVSSGLEQCQITSKSHPTPSRKAIFVPILLLLLLLLMLLMFLLLLLSTAAVFVLSAFFQKSIFISFLKGFAKKNFSAVPFFWQPFEFLIIQPKLLSFVCLFETANLFICSEREKKNNE